MNTQDNASALAQARDPGSPPALLLALVGRSREVNLAIAENPSATPEVLRRLRDLYHGPTTQRVARHPNVPPELLPRLAQGQPAAFLQNPALSLWQLERIDFWSWLGIDALRALLRSPEAPLGLLSWAAGQSNVQILIALAESPLLSEEMLEHFLFRDEREFVVAAMVRNPKVRPGQLARLYTDARLPVRRAALSRKETPTAALVQAARDAATWDLLIAHPNVPASLQQSLLERAKGQPANARSSIYWALAQCKTAPPALLVALHQQADEPRLDYFLAKNPSTPLSLLVQLTRYAAEVVAADPRVPEDLLSQLAEDKRANVRRTVLQNPSAPAAVLARAAQSELPEERLCAASHPKTPPAALALLEHDASEAVRVALVKNPSAPPELLARLVMDPVLPLSRLARQYRAAQQVPPPALPAPAPEAEDLAALTREERQQIAKNPEVSPEVLRRLYFIDPKVFGLAQNPQTPVDILWALWRAGEGALLFWNPALPQALRLVLLHATDRRQRQQARRSQIAQWKSVTQARPTLAPPHDVQGETRLGVDEIGVL